MTAPASLGPGQVANTDNANYNSIVAGLKNVSHRGDSVDLSTFRLDQLLPSPANLSRYYRYTGSLTTPDCNQNVLWTVFEEQVSIGRLQLDLFVSTALSSAPGDPPVRMINNFRPTQPRRGRPVLASRDATVSAAPPSAPPPLALLSALLGLRLVLGS
ncbi:carbonic anhydrase 15-like [Tachyglossus aculeatus]|uniref:carbonic anhydrase 15-like n=1 Tax=Tachyglossus aculeatus TaxID=9261 RepID=UPI0018F5869F|nr:carbonic anhydrase 15-like [Tachyglossus aculeatus]